MLVVIAAEGGIFLFAGKMGGKCLFGNSAREEFVRKMGNALQMSYTPISGEDVNVNCPTDFAKL